MLTDSGGVPVPVVCKASETLTTTTPVVSECCAPDGAAVLASLRTKMVHCIDEQRGRIEDFARWFDELVASPDFVASVDRWT